MRSFAYPLAVLIVVVGCFAVVVLAAGVDVWARWLVRLGGILGIVGLVVTGIAAVNLLVPRTCSTEGGVKEVNRPVLSVAFDEGDCYQAAAAQLVVVPVLGVAASVLVIVRRSGLRPSGRADDGAAPFAPFP